MDVSQAASGKGDRDENFPVASLIAPRHRQAVLDFYHYVRAADDVSDHPTMPAEEKLRLLDGLAAALKGEGPDAPVAARLRATLAQRKLAPDHALDLIVAFKRDCVKNRTRDWDDLIDYCRYSAMPVGRYMLDLHGEDRATWAPSDDLCAALQIINHLQDCAKDYRELDRVYLPGDLLARHGADVKMLGAEKSAPPLRAAIVETARRTQDLLARSARLAGDTRDLRLAMNIAAIQKLAESLTRGLLARDPLCEKVHAGKARFAMIAGLAAAGAALRHPFKSRAA
jgi:squalene synthase HpnC